MKKRPETAQRGDVKKLSFFASVQNTDGLNFVRLDQPEKLTIKLINNGWDSFLTELAKEPANRARITIDLSKAGDEVNVLQPPDPIPGFTMTTDEKKLVYTFEQQVVYWSWLTSDWLAVRFPEILMGGGDGVGIITASVENIEGGINAKVDAALFRLKPGGVPNNFAANWKYDNIVRVSGRVVDDGGGVLKIIISNADGFIRPEMIDDQQPTFFIMLSDGFSTGYNALMPPEQATAVEVEVAEDEPWLVKTIDNTAYPVWQVVYDPAKPPSSGDIQVKLNNVQSLETNIDKAQILLYFMRVPGMADGYQVVNVQLSQMTAEPGSGGLDIVSFTVNNSDNVTLKNINAPTQVLLSWNVQNAGYVTLSGRGIVDAQVSQMNIDVEQTTVFTLTAYSASLAQAVSKNVKVTVLPDLLTRVIPIGTILIWSGSKETIPSGWALCDGNNRTPNLQDKFVMGAGYSQNPGTSGPAQTHTHNIAPPQTNFNSTVNGRHSHAMPNAWYNRGLSCGKWAGIDSNGEVRRNTEDAGDHSHTVTVAIPQFQSGPNDGTVLPPWFALCYIQKLGV
jgi:hypothetical protein